MNLVGIMISFYLYVMFFLVQNMLGSNLDAHHLRDGVLMKDILEKDPDMHSREHSRMKRSAGLTAGVLGASISPGASLAGTTVRALMSSSYRVAVSGSVENFSKWPLVLQECEIKSGYMNVPMRSVAPGEREGFAGHKTGHTATGNWVKCSFKVANKYMVHFMYSAPYNFKFHSNWLTVAVCELGVDRECPSLSAYTMYYYRRPFMRRRQYYYNVKTVKFCGDRLCVTGVMGTSHQPMIHIRVMPRYYSDLCHASKAASVRGHWNAYDYQRFVKSLF